MPTSTCVCCASRTVVLPRRASSRLMLPDGGSDRTAAEHDDVLSTCGSTIRSPFVKSSQVKRAAISQHARAFHASFAEKAATVSASSAGGFDFGRVAFTVALAAP
eukprot:5840895-Prymnesium_polylepis.1